MSTLTEAIRKHHLSLAKTLEAHAHGVGGSEPQTEREERIVVSINAQERIFVGDRPINLQLLEDTMRGMMEGRPRKVVYLRADESIRYGRVIAVVDKLKNAGVDQIGFAYSLPEEKARR